MTMLQNPALAARQLPGSLGLWIFIFSDLMLFGLYFALLVFDMRSDPISYANAQASLSQSLGLINTLLLLSGSWAVVMATRIAQQHKMVSAYLMLAIVTGMVFLLIKAVEYTHVIQAGHHLTENAFFIWYFFLSGYHALHVIAGCLLLGFLWQRSRQQQTVNEELSTSIACYWHLVDLLWIGIFSFAYLL